MNNAFKNVIIFASGAVTGALCTWFTVKKIYELKADLEVESVREAYDEKVSQFEHVKSTVNGELTGPSEIDDGKVHLNGNKSSVTRELLNKPPLTDYRAFFKGTTNESIDVRELARNPLDEVKSDEEAAESEHPEDDKPMTDEEDAHEQNMYETYELNKDRSEKLNREPYEIGEEEYEFGEESYEKVDLLYYIQDDILVNAEGEIEDKEPTVGDVLESSDFSRNDSEYLYVRNDRLEIDFFIKKMFREYTGE